MLLVCRSPYITIKEKNYPFLGSFFTFNLSIPFLGSFLTFNLSIPGSYKASSSALLCGVQEVAKSDAQATNAKAKKMFLIFMYEDFKLVLVYKGKGRKKRPSSMHYIDKMIHYNRKITPFIENALYYDEY